jgi:flagellar motor component MotA
MTRLFFVFLGLVPIVGAIMMHSSPVSFIDLPSFLVVVVPSFALTCAAHGFGGQLENGGLIDALKAGMGADPSASPNAQQHMVTLQTLRNTLCCAGAVGTLLGFIMMLGNMDDPSAIGPAMAVALFSGLYGIGFAELLVAPMIQRFKSGESGDSNASGDGPRGALIAITAILANTGLFFVLLFSMAPYA